MPKNVRTARGEVIDFDMLVLKQKIADAPMNIEVQRRREFIDSKEGKGRGARAAQPEDQASLVQPTTAADFEVEGEDPAPTKRK